MLVEVGSEAQHISIIALFVTVLGVRSARLNVLEKFMKELPVNTLSHFEMASFTEESLLKELVDKVLPYCDSLGMNEQELPNILGVLCLFTCYTVSRLFCVSHHMLG